MALAGLLAAPATAEALEVPRETSTENPLGPPDACPDIEVKYHGAGEPTSGCLMWERDSPGDAVASIPADGEVIAAGFDGTTLEIQRLDPSGGEANWTQRVPLDQAYRDMTIEVDAQHEQVYLGWDTLQFDGLSRNPSYEEGGLASLDLTTGALDWTRDDGSSGLALGPEGERVYYGVSEPGHKWGRSAPLGAPRGPSEDPAAIRVHALYAANGSQAWTNSTSLWWTIHTADAVGRTTDIRCMEGPAEVEVGPDGTVLVVNDPQCDVGGVLAAFRGEGQLTYLKTFPNSLTSGETNRCQSDCTAYRDAALALHPAGHTIFVAWSDYLASYDVGSGDKRWDNLDDDHMEPCPTEGTGTCADHLAGGSDMEDTTRWTEGLGKDLAVTSTGTVVLTGFESDDDLGSIQPWLSVYDGETGYWVAGNEEIQTWDTLMDASRTPRLRSDIEIGDAGHAIYAAFQADDKARAFGYLFTGDALWGVQEPLWEARSSTGEPADWAANIAPGSEGIVVGDANLTGHRPSQALAAIHRAGERMPDGLSREIQDLQREAQRTVTRGHQGDQVKDGIPTVLVEADKSFQAEVNISEPGLYYLLLENATSGETYVFQDPTAMSGENIPVAYGCGSSTFTDMVNYCEAPDPIEKERVCTSDGPWEVRTRSTDGNCYGRSREDPVTVTRANRVDGRAVHNGSALFGPVVLTEGRYAILEQEEGNDPIESAEQMGFAAAARCTSDLSFPPDRQLVECLEVRIHTGDEAAGPGQNPDPVPGMTSTSETSEPQCQSDSSTELFVSPVKIEPRQTGKYGGRILQSSVQVFGFALERYPSGDDCVYNTGTALANATFLLDGTTSFYGTTEWTVVFSLSGECSHLGIPASCSLGIHDTSIELAQATSCLPDQGDVYVDGVLGEPGTTAEQRRISEETTDLLYKIADEAIGRPVFGLGRAALDWVGLVENALFRMDCETDEMNDCGRGCQEWGWTVTGTEQFIHRYNMRAAGCGTVEYPVGWSLRSASLRFYGDRGPASAWTTDIPSLEQSVGLELDRRQCDG